MWNSSVYGANAIWTTSPSYLHSLLSKPFVGEFWYNADVARTGLGLSIIVDGLLSDFRRNAQVTLEGHGDCTRRRLSFVRDFWCIAHITRAGLGNSTHRQPSFVRDFRCYAHEMRAGMEIPPVIDSLLPGLLLFSRTVKSLYKNTVGTGDCILI